METIERWTDVTPLILLVAETEAMSRTVESTLRPKGFIVLRAYSGQQALDLATKVSPDAVLIDMEKADPGVNDILRQLRASPTIYATTPMLLVTDAPMGRAGRLEALSAGAWDILTHPVDPNELILRLDTFVRAKHEADRVRDEGLTDPGTGLYNVRGILRRTREVSADAIRSDRPLTCVAIGLTSPGVPHVTDSGRDSEDRESLSDPMAEALRTVTRSSDTLGRLGPDEFIVIAPGTDRAGAVRLAERVLEGIVAEAARRPMAEGTDRIRAGVYGMDPSEPAAPEDLLLRATLALRSAQEGNGTSRVRAYEA